MHERLLRFDWTSGQSRSPVLDLRFVNYGTLLIPASWNGSALVTVYVYTQAIANAPSFAEPAPTSTGLQLYNNQGAAIEITVAASTAVLLPPGVFGRFVAFNSASGPTAGLSWQLDGKR